MRVLSQGEPEHFKEGSGRLELARAIATPSNPLTARVIVNRLWRHVMGRSLVDTPSNFGKLGAEPTHSELLDDLAVRFVEGRWSIKTLVRELVLSSTYRQSSKTQLAGEARDPDNTLYWRAERRRLEVEAWRDALLAATGRIDASIGGPSIEPDDPKATRRTVYSRISRFQLNPLLSMFDFPDPNVHSSGRVKTTTPLQKLFVLNSSFMTQAATDLAARYPVDSEASLRTAISSAHRELYGRAPDSGELELADAFLNASDDRASRWREYCQVLLAANELLFVD